MLSQVQVSLFQASKYITVDAKGDQNVRNFSVMSQIPHSNTCIINVHAKLKYKCHSEHTLMYTEAACITHTRTESDQQGHQLCNRVYPQIAAVAAQIGVQQSTVCPIACSPSGKDRHIDANAALTWHKEWRLCLLCL